MSASFLGKEKEADIRVKLEELFSSGFLEHKEKQAFDLSQAEGLGLFILSLPWRVVVSGKEPISGYSETLRMGLKDIHATLVTLGRVYPSDTAVTLEIDEARLSAFSPKRTAEQLEPK